MMRKSALFCLTLALATVAAAVPVPLPPTALSIGGKPAPAPNNDTFFNSMTFAGPALVPRGMYAGGGWVDLVGSDAGTGFAQPRSPTSPWGGNAVYPDSIQLIGNSPLTDQTRTIVTTGSGGSVPAIGPSGSTEKILQLTFSAPYEQNVGGISFNTSQNSYIIFPDQSVQQGMVYESWWVYLQADLASRFNSFFSVSETKTASSERHTFGIVPTGGGLTWQLSHNKVGGTFVDYYDVALSQTSSNLAPGQTHAAPIPLGQWFRIEWAHKFVPGQPGWMWLALTIPGSSDATLKAGGQVFFEQASHWDPNIGEIMNRLFEFQAYSDLTRSSGSPFSFYLAQMKIATAWPSTATAHPAVN
jgi:hypothetical protein